MIYFAQTGDNRFIKIGFATNVTKRVEGLRTGSPMPIKVLATMSGTIPIERQLHARFDHLRVNREWFESSRALVEFALSASQLAGIASDYDPILPYIVREPRIIPILVDAACAVDDPNEDRFCANEVFFGYANPRNSLKYRISHLVGWHADNVMPELLSEDAYNTVYERIYDALPNCRNCGCF